MWHSGGFNDVQEELGYYELREPFRKEIKRFLAMVQVDRSNREQIRDALLRVLKKRTHREEARNLTSGKALRDWWVKVIRHNLDLLKKEMSSSSQSAHASSSVTQTFLRSLKSKDASHPRGEGTRNLRSPIPSSGSDGEDDNSSTDDSYIVASSSDSDNAHTEPAEDKPLVFDDEARANIKLIKQAKDADDLKDRTATFMADRFMFGSSYVHDMLTGKTPWPRFSKQEFYSNCNKAATLYDNVLMREELGKELSSKARKRMLKSEFDTIREIRTSLHIARLGPGEGKEYRDKVTTEASRSDFQKTFSDPKAFKWYMRSLAEVKKSRKARTTSNSNSFRGGTGPYRPPRRSSNSRRRGSAGRGRSNYNRPRSSYGRSYSGNRGRYQQSRNKPTGPSRRYGSAPKGRRRQRF
jgi:hypothetical protein